MTPEQLRVAGVEADLPASTVYAIERYVTQRAQPVPFLYSIIANNLMEAMVYLPRDMTPQELRSIVRLVHNFVPGRARGSRENVAAWINGSTPAPTEKDPRP